MPDCSITEILEGIDPSTCALNKVAGVNARIYVGEIKNINSATLAFDANGAVTTFAMATGTYLWQFISKKYKQAGRDELVPQDPPVWNHFVDFVHYWFTQEEIRAIENLAKTEDVFCIIQENSGNIRVYGISNDSQLGYLNFGLSAKTGGSQTGTTGVLLNDDNTDKTTLSGQVPNKPMLYKPTNTLAANIAELDGMSHIDS